MPRYIDADDMKLSLKNLPQWGGEVLLVSVLDAVDRQFTADVAPRAEVAREIFDDIERLMFANRFFTLGGACYHKELKDCIAELKKKYVETR